MGKFGKKDQDFNSFLTSYSTVRDGRRTAKKSGGGGKGGFGDRWAPPKIDDGDEPQEIILFPGDYNMPISVGKKRELQTLNRKYYIAFEHGYKNQGRYRSCTCAAGLKLIHTGDDWDLQHGDDDCVPCYHIDEGTADISRRLLHVFNLIVLGNFHLVDSDRTDPNGKPYKEWASCNGKRCAHCKDGSPKTYGRRQFWSMGKRFINQLLTHADTVLSKYCKCGGSLDVVGFECLACGDVIIDFDDTPMDKKEVNQFKGSSHKCPHCGSVDYPEPVVECSTCTKPTPLDVWDVKYSLARSGEGTDTSLMISEWQILDDKTVDRVSKLMKPYEFDKGLFKKPDLAHQAKLLGIPNPFKDDEDAPKGSVDWKDVEEDDIPF